jgi:lysophospholipase L1-like esterase
MKKIISVIALSVAFAATAPAQGVLGGILGGNTQSTLGNIISMCELAKLHKIKPILCSALPAGQFRWRKEITDAPDRVRTLNALLKDYAKKNKIVYLDYYPLMDDGNGSLPEALSKDTVHPTLEGYKIMEEAVLKVLR